MYSLDHVSTANLIIPIALKRSGASRASRTKEILSIKADITKSKRRG